jgi:hypothetical protein
MKITTDIIVFLKNNMPNTTIIYDKNYSLIIPKKKNYSLMSLQKKKAKLVCRFLKDFFCFTLVP